MKKPLKSDKEIDDYIEAAIDAWRDNLKSKIGKLRQNMWSVKTMEQDVAVGGYNDAIDDVLELL